MATYKCREIDANTLFRSRRQGPFTLSNTFTFKSGTDPAQNDIIKFLRIPAGVVPLEIVVIASDFDTNGTPTITGDLGYTQVVDKDGNAVDSSPTSDPDAYVASNGVTCLQTSGVQRWVAGQSGLDNEFANFDADGYAGPVDIALTITAAAATDPSTDRSVTVVFTGITVPLGETESDDPVYTYNNATLPA